MTAALSTVDTLQAARTYHRERHIVLAGNIVNQDTPGYHPVDLERRPAGAPAALAPTHESHIAARATTDVATSLADGGVLQDPDSNPVSLERERSTIDANGARYATAAELVSPARHAAPRRGERHPMSAMDVFTAMDVAASGLSAGRTWMNIAAPNLANAQTTQAAGSGPYRRRVATQSVDVPGIQGTPVTASRAHEAGSTTTTAAADMAPRAQEIRR